MTSRWEYLIKPHGQEYNNTKKIAGVDLTVNATIENAQFVNRLGSVYVAPKGSEIPVGSLVVLHHNIFRTYLDMKGRKRKSNEYYRDGLYLVSEEKIYLYKDEENWKTTSNYCFVSPVDYLQSSDIYRDDKKEEKHVGVVRYVNSPLVSPGDTVAFKKNSEYRFDINEEKLYRMRVNDICVKL